MKTRIAAALLFSAVMATAGCYQQGPATTVQRTNANTQVDLSGNWNDTDANQVANAMIKDCLSRPWASQFKQEKGRKPVVKLYPIRNRSSEHINTKFFTKQVEREILNSGIADVVAASDETGAARAERRDQAANASDKTVKSNQQETGTDFVLNGWVISSNDAAGGAEVRAYLTTMELVNVQSQKKVWIGQKRIKKVVQRRSSQW
ncbi:MAG: penicillin-binding protein activator LpoB [Myxococcales bacterium]|nr:penicillin-binding protein activator LpoB [Myxococcales bacterium]